MIKYDDFAQKRTIRPVTPYPGSPLYYDAIRMGLLDKNNPAEDFYERKHLNSDLICTNFTELSDEEFYECLRWANTELMRNYYNKQRDSTEDQIKYLYETKDVTFRGFRFGGGKVKENIPSESFKKSKLNNRKNHIPKEGIQNWEHGHTGDGERFSQQAPSTIGEKNTQSFNIYLERKAKRKAEKQRKSA